MTTNPTPTSDPDYENNIMATGAIHGALMAAQGAGCGVLRSEVVMDNGLATNQIDIQTNVMLSTYRITIERVEQSERLATDAVPQ